MKKILTTFSLVLFTCLQSTLLLGDCKKVTIADMNWNSASLIARIDQFILTYGFNCRAELVPGDTMATATSMTERSRPHIAPELWVNSMKAAIDKGVSDGRLTIAGNPFAKGGDEGFWVPVYLVKKYPNIATISGIKKHAHIFKHPEDPDKAAFMGCPSGWSCQITTENLFRALKLKSVGFDLIDPGSSASLAGSLARAYDKKEPWLGYYWAPTALLGKYKMVKVDLGAKTDIAHFRSCIAVNGCLNPKVTTHPPSEVKTIVASTFAKKAPVVFSYLGRRSFQNQDLNRILAWMEANQASGDEALKHFFLKEKKIWSQWLNKDTVSKIDNAMKKVL